MRLKKILLLGGLLKSDPDFLVARQEMGGSGL